MNPRFENYLDTLPGNPANEREPVVRFGQICPNQFAHIEEPIAGLDEQLDFDDARGLAKELSVKYGMTVAVEVQDEHGELIETRCYSATKN